LRKIGNIVLSSLLIPLCLVLLSGCGIREYTLSVYAKDGGKIATDTHEYCLKEDEQISIRAVPDDGYLFERWSTDAGGAFKNENASETSFTMPGEDCVVYAHFKKSHEENGLNEAPQTYALTIEVTEGGTVPAGQKSFIDGNYPEGTKIAILVRPMEGYYFTHWTSSNGGSFENEKSSTTYFTMPANSTVITAHFSPLNP